jgi:hypothetical protein
MKKLIIVLLIAIPFITLGQQSTTPIPQDATIERVEFSGGITETRLSPDLRADIQKLVGQAYNADAVTMLTQDIQVELPEYVVAATTQPGSQQNRIRVVLVAAKISDNEALKTNINSRYTIDDYSIEGIKVQTSDELNADLQKLIGVNVDNEELNKLAKRINHENSRKNVDVTWKLKRSAAAQHVRVVFDVAKPKNTINFSLANPVYHSKQGASGIWAVGYSYKSAGMLKVTMANTAEELIERYAGYRAAYSIDVHSFNFDVSYSSFRTQWKTNTLVADTQDPQSPGLYRLRDTLSETTTVKLPHTLKASAGVSFTELQMQTPTLGFQKANEVIGTLTAGQFEVPGLPPAPHWSLFYGLRTGTRTLDSDFVFTRHEAKASYGVSWKGNEISMDAQVGRVTGQAPMFERFSLGSGYTLRGWNKYEINPLGGNRMAYGKTSFSRSILTVFYDVGSVWDAGQPGSTRHSVGVSLHEKHCRPPSVFYNPACLRLTLGVPLENGHVKPVFIIGL